MKKAPVSQASGVGKSRRPSTLEMIPEEPETDKEGKAEVKVPKQRLEMLERIARIWRNIFLAFGIVFVGFGSIFVAFGSVAKFSSVKLRKPGVVLLSLGSVFLLVAVIWIAHRSHKNKHNPHRRSPPQPRQLHKLNSTNSIEITTEVDQHDVQIVIRTDNNNKSRYVTTSKTFDPEQPSTSGLQANRSNRISQSDLP